LIFSIGGCSFSADGSKLYVSIKLQESPEIPKVSEIDVATGRVVRTWTTDGNIVPVIQALPNGKVYALSQEGFSHTGDLKVIGTDGEIKSVDLGMMPEMIAATPDGLAAYIEGSAFVDGKYTPKSVVINTETDEVVYEGTIFPNETHSFASFPSRNDSLYMLVGGYGAISVNLGQKTSKYLITRNGVGTHYLVSHRETDGLDTVVLLREGGIDVFRTEQPPTVYDVVPTSSFKGEAITPRGYYSIIGYDLISGEAVSDRWWEAKFGMAGVSVKVCGIPSRMIMAAQSQISFVTPSGITPGEKCDITVTSPLLGEAIIAQVPVVERDLSLFMMMLVKDGMFFLPSVAVMTNAQYQLLGPPAVTGTTPPIAQPPKPGDVIVLWGNGCGVPYPDDQNTPMEGVRMSSFPKITIGGVNAVVEWAGLAPTLAAVCQINVKIPSSLPQQSAEIPYQLVLEGGASYSLWVNTQ
jgi:uncharacterized protein (TIGR03437 family)